MVHKKIEKNIRSQAERCQNVKSKMLGKMPLQLFGWMGKWKVRSDIFSRTYQVQFLAYDFRLACSKCTFPKVIYTWCSYYFGIIVTHTRANTHIFMCLLLKQFHLPHNKIIKEESSLTSTFKSEKCHFLSYVDNKTRPKWNSQAIREVLWSNICIVAST